MKRRPIIVTRAGAPGRALAAALEDAGEEVVWVPAFEFGPPPDEARLAVAISQLGSYQLVVFVSPAAAAATAARLKSEWPDGTAIGAVGEGTQRAILAGIPSADRAQMFVPAAGEAEGPGGGSEALWEVLRPVLGEFRRVLILRAQHGREFLGEQLALENVSAETVAVYTRNVATLAPEKVSLVRRWQADGRAPALVVASSEAVDVLPEMFAPLGGAAWMHTLRLLTTHERVRMKLLASGYEQVATVTLDVDSIRKAASAQ